MPRRIHLVAATVALLCIATFLVSTIAVELAGTPPAVAALKSAIVAPGLWLLVPAIAAAGGSGFAAARSRGGRLADAKRRRMPLIAANGLLVLVPCAIVLDRWAAAGALDARFYAVQLVEIVAGATNLALMLLNVRDGLRMTGRIRPAAAAAATSR